MNHQVSERRSENMRAIKSKNTKPEMFVRKALHAKGFRYILHSKKLPGHPDLVLPKYKTIIDIRGCFWHGHICSRGNVPKSNVDYWKPKISGNIKRDLVTQDKLEKSGWDVMVIWECELNSISRRQNTINRIETELFKKLIK